MWSSSSRWRMRAGSPPARLAWPAGLLDPPQRVLRLFGLWRRLSALAAAAANACDTPGAPAVQHQAASGG
jgi:hypothetical protein